MTKNVNPTKEETTYIYTENSQLSEHLSYLRVHYVLQKENI